jgi:hypothetical protein
MYWIFCSPILFNGDRETTSQSWNFPLRRRKISGTEQARKESV